MSSFAAPLRHIRSHCIRLRTFAVPADAPSHFSNTAPLFLFSRKPVESLRALSLLPSAWMKVPSLISVQRRFRRCFCQHQQNFSCLSTGICSFCTVLSCTSTTYTLLSDSSFRLRFRQNFCLVSITSVSFFAPRPVHIKSTACTSAAYKKHVKSQCTKNRA